MLTLLEIIKKTTEFFDKRGVESARLNAELLVGHALGLKRMQLYIQFERPLAEPELEKIRPLVKRRGNREPLQHILGTTEFAGLTLKVDRRALIPRPETEYLIELLVQRFPTPPARVLDLGTGTGAIALALAKAWPEAQVVAVEQSEEALALARENAEACGLAAKISLLRSNWYDALTGSEKFALIVSNPPYLSDEETEAAQPEVKEYEPHQALSAGQDSAAALEQIIKGARDRLTADGCLALETGIAQHARLLALLQKEGFGRCESRKDLTGRDRFVLAAL
jgi:release factor glutamine methyltransferase